MTEFRELIFKPLYSVWEIELDKDGYEYTISKENLNRFLKLINLSKYNILDVPCTQCKRDLSFSVSHPFSEYARGTSSHSIKFNDDTLITIRNNKVSYINRNFQINLSCSHDNTKYSFFYKFIRKDSKLVIKKIGQIPELYEIENFEKYGFKKQLEKIKIDKDFFDLHVMLSYGYAVDTLLYIRRIIEKMVNYYLSDDEIKGNRFEDRVKIAQEKSSFVDPDIEEVLKLVFKLSSDGIHSLSNKDCEKYLGPLYNFVVIQLDYMKEQDDKKNLKSDNNKLINKLFSKK